MANERTGVAHFTAVEHLASIIERGLLCDDLAKAEQRLRTEVGDREVKNRRQTREVPVAPGGPVSSYVPFYFAPRSPMMFKIWKGQVVGYNGGLDPIIYLVTSLQLLSQVGLKVIVTDGNAANTPTRFSANPSDVDELVDWQLMRATMWRNTPDDPDRMRRRMAECLVKDSAPFNVFERIVVRTDEIATAARTALRDAGLHLPVEIKANWYYP